jgi:dienelactone hydrolase
VHFAAPLLFFLAAPTVLSADELQQYGVGRRDTTFYRAGRTLHTAVYYPATSSGSGAPLNTSGAPYPLLVFAIGKRMQVEHYLSYYEHLAASGYVVMAPQFPDVDSPSAYTWNEDLRDCITQALNARTVPGSVFYQAIDPGKIGLFGHSFGGGTVVGVAADDGRVRVTCAIAPNNPGNYSFNKMPNVHTPIHILGAELDAINSVEAIGRPLYERGNPDKALLVVKGGNHMQFSDYTGFDSVDTPATITRAQQLAITKEHLVNLFDAYLKGRSSARTQLYGTATLTKDSVFLWFETQAASASRLVYVSGNGQSAPPGQLTLLPVVFKVVDAQGNALPRHTVHFQITAGGGSLAGQTWRDLETDADGLVSIYPRLGPSEGVANNLIAVSAYKGTAHLTDSPQTVALSGTTQPLRRIVVHSDPATLTYQVDNVAYSSPQTFLWPTGSSHTVSAPSPQGEAAGTRFVFSSWSDGGALSHAYTVPARDDTLVVTFRTQYLLTLASAYGAPTGGGWYDAGSVASFRVDRHVPAGQARRMSLSGWVGTGSGSYSGPDSAATVTMHGPVTETAIWHTEFFLTTAQNPPAGGTVSPAPPGAWYDSSATVTLVATPAPGYAWGSWSGTINSTVNPLSFVMTGPTAATANFVRLALLTFRTEPPGLTVVVDTVSYVIPRTFSWLPGSVHTVSATSPQAGGAGVQYLFDSWSDGNPRTHNLVTPARDDTLVARFRTQFFLAVQSAHGSPRGQGWYDSGAQAAFSVTTPDSQAGTRHLFQQWTGDFTGTSPSGTVLMDRPKTVTALWKTQHLLTVLSPYCTASGAGWHDEGSQALFRVQPCVVYDSAGTRRVFAGWTGTGPGSYTGPDSTGTIVVQGPVTEVASWQTQYQLTVSSPYGSPVGAGWYPAGATAHFAVTSPEVEGLRRHVFRRWSGHFSGTQPAGTLVMRGPRTVTAEWGDQFYLAITAEPPEGGTVTPQPPGDWFEADSVLLVHASPSPGFAFGGWDGDLKGNANPASLLIDRPKEVSALFVPMGMVRVTSEPENLLVIVDGTSCLTPHDFVWQPGSVHTVEAVSPQQYDRLRHTFQFWNDGGARTHSVTVTGPAVFVAHYQKEFFVATACSPPEGGSIVPPPPGAWVAEGEALLLQATANGAQGYLFAGWSGDLVGTDNPDTLLVTEPKQVTANFVKIGHTTIATVPEGLSIIVDGTRYTAPQEFVWAPGSSHLIAVESPQAVAPGLRYVFEEWSDHGAQSHTITASSGAFYTASFRAEYAVSIAVEPQGAGTVELSPPGGWYQEGASVTLTARPDSAQGYEFARWSGHLTGSDNPATLAVDCPKAVVAHFVASDVLPPLLVYVYPPAGATFVPTNTAIDLAISDNPGGRGLDAKSVVVSVNGTTVVNGGSVLPGQQATLRVRDGLATLHFVPAVPLAPQRPVEVRVQAADLASRPHTLDTTFTFTLGPYPVLVTAMETIGPQGGFVTDPVHKLQISVPADALSDSTTMTIAVAPSPPPLPDSLLAVGPTFYLGPDGLSFLDSVTVAMPYTQADLVATGANEPSAMPVYRFDTARSRWERLRVGRVYRNFLLVPMRSFCYLLFCGPRGTQVVTEQAPLPEVFALRGGFPNPFNSGTTFVLDLPHPCAVKLTFYDASGRRVASVDAGVLPAGSHRLPWEARDARGDALPTGIYLCRVEAGAPGASRSPAFIATRKIALVR